MDLKAYLENKRAVVDRALEEALPQAGGPEKQLIRAMRYSLFAGGKRLRPILCIAGCEAVGGNPTAALPAAVALEMVHTYSLIHDDLPGMDDDEMRRGRPACHMVYGEGMAILAGDGLLTLAFEVLAGAGRSAGANPLRILAASERLARASGRLGMVTGQAVDIEYEGRQVDPEIVRFIHANKTGALLTASVTMGALLGGGGEEKIQALTEYGRDFGLAFQITDDILDIEGDSTEIGKPAGSDQARGKQTWPQAFGLEAARKEAADRIAAAIRALEAFGMEAEPLRAVAKYVLSRKN